MCLVLVRRNISYQATDQNIKQITDNHTLQHLLEIKESEITSLQVKKAVDTHQIQYLLHEIEILKNRSPPPPVQNHQNHNNSDQLVRLNRRVQEERTKYLELLIRHDDVENLNKHQDEKIKELNNTIEVEQGKVSALEEQLSRLENRVKDKENELQVCLSQITQQGTQLNELLNEGKLLTAENLELGKKIKNLGCEKNRLEKKNLQLNKKHHEEVSELQEKIDALKEELNKAAPELQKSEENTNQNLQNEPKKPAFKDNQCIRLRKSNGRRVKMLVSERKEQENIRNVSQNEPCHERVQTEEDSLNSQHQTQKESTRIVFDNGRLKISLENRDYARDMSSTSFETGEGTVPPVILTRVDDMNWTTSDKSGGDKNA
ncbi:unnamed protein product [Orchesella dallaii]|uniref:Uncharacterized protein n=1 Tax=Orchesella dallaii TaxID=48710 RepID=A0ABP1RHW0_9HEXA